MGPIIMQTSMQTLASTRHLLKVTMSTTPAAPPRMAARASRRQVFIYEYEALWRRLAASVRIAPQRSGALTSSIVEGCASWHFSGA